VLPCWAWANAGAAQVKAPLAIAQAIAKGIDFSFNIMCTSPWAFLVSNYVSCFAVSVACDHVDPFGVAPSCNMHYGRASAAWLNDA
jgi:hypothetical protein